MQLIARAERLTGARVVATVLLALGLAGCGSVLPTSPPPTSRAPTTAPPGSPTALSPSPTAVPSEAAWTHVTITTAPSSAFGATSDEIVAGTAWPGGFLFIGETFSGEGPTEILWRSPDGSTWTRTAVPAFAGTDVRAVTWTGQRLVVVAAVHPASGVPTLVPPLGFAWTSTDATTWAPVTDPDGSLPQTLPTSIGSGPAGVVISGGRPNGASSLLHSSDGLAWAADNTSTPVFSGVKFGGSVVGWAGGFLLAASVPAVITPPTVWAPPSAAAFRSADGVAWVKGSVPPGAESLSFITAGDHIVAVGDTCVACVGAFASWSTADQGATWQMVAAPSQGFPSVGTMVASTDSRFVDISAGRLRRSDDGRSWHTLVSSGTPLSPDYFFDLLVRGNRVALVGWQGIFPPDQPAGPKPLILLGQLG